MWLPKNIELRSKVVNFLINLKILNVSYIPLNSEESEIIHNILAYKVYCGFEIQSFSLAI